jgi:hypothetical protein
LLLCAPQARSDARVLALGIRRWLVRVEGGAEPCCARCEWKRRLHLRSALVVSAWVAWLPVIEAGVSSCGRKTMRHHARSRSTSSASRSSVAPFDAQVGIPDASFIPLTTISLHVFAQFLLQLAWATEVRRGLGSYLSIVDRNQLMHATSGNAELALVALRCDLVARARISPRVVSGQAQSSSSATTSVSRCCLWWLRVFVRCHLSVAAQTGRDFALLVSFTLRCGR